MKLVKLFTHITIKVLINSKNHVVIIKSLCLG